MLKILLLFYTFTLSSIASDLDDEIDFSDPKYYMDYRTKKSPKRDELKHIPNSYYYIDKRKEQKRAKKKPDHKQIINENIKVQEQTIDIEQIETKKTKKRSHKRRAFISQPPIQEQTLDMQKIELQKKKRKRKLNDANSFSYNIEQEVYLMDEPIQKKVQGFIPSTRPSSLPLPTVIVLDYSDFRFGFLGLF